MQAQRFFPRAAVTSLLLLGLGTLRGYADAPQEQTETQGPIGWATAGEGTSGGAGGPDFEVFGADALAKLLGTADAKVVRVTGSIALESPLRVGSNTSLIGVGADARLVGGGLHLRKVHNVIVRNLAVTEASDAVGIEESHHVWIDHCDFSKCRDGLVDVKRGSDFITVSWNHFHDHHKTCLLGHSDKPDIRAIDSGHLRVTYHHNFFDGTQTRHPRVRFADAVHVFNNYYRGNDYGVASVMDAGVIVEGNCFEDVRRPTLTAYGDSPDPGRLLQRENLFIRSGKPEARGVVDEKALGYAYRLDAAKAIAEIVTRGAGVGRISGENP